MIGTEWLGTAASVIIAISLMQKNLKWLRILNLAGAAGFAVYGFFLRAWPVFGLNGFIALIDIWYLIDLLTRNDKFSHYFCDPEKDPFCGEFLKFHKTDINRFFPDAGGNLIAGTRGCVILRNLVPVSLVIYRQERPETIQVLIDYATPPFRDFRNARYFLEKAVHTGELSEIRELRARAADKNQAGYFQHVGYKPVEGEKMLFSYRSGLF
jgi:hypothetical protein